MKPVLITLFILCFLPLTSNAAQDHHAADASGAPAIAEFETEMRGLHVPAEHDTIAVHHDDGHGSSGLPQLDPAWYPSQIFWLILMFSIMYLYFSKKLLPSIAHTIENREHHIKNDLLSAEKLTEEAEETQKLYEQKLSNSRIEASAVFEKMEASLRQKSEKMQADFAKDADKKITDVKVRLDKEINTAQKDIEEQISTISTLAAEQIAGIKTNAKDAKSVIKSLNDNKKAEAA